MGYMMIKTSDNLSYNELKEALNILRLAHKESSQAFIRASYSKKIQTIFDELEKE